MARTIITDPFYTPKGKAREYTGKDNIGLNVYKYCPNGCIYCYCPFMLCKKPIEFYNEPDYTDNIIARVKLYAYRYARKEVFLSFIGDIGIIDKNNYFVQILEIFKNHNIRPRILTKSNIHNLLPLLKECNAILGCTIVTIKESIREKNEPFASTISERLQLLNEAKCNGIKTWISIEPIIDVYEILTIVRYTQKYIDYYFIGKMNYNDIGSNETKLKEVLPMVYEFLSMAKISFTFGEDTKLLINKCGYTKV